MVNSYPKNVTDLHLELTDKCQASCPMCARNISGGVERPFVGKHEIYLEDFQQWFDQDFLQNCRNIYACGNYGDPIIARDCLEIFDYIRSINPYCHLGIHTNGSARDPQWWAKLAEIFGDNHTCTFGIDGFESSHILYRRGTDWKKIIRNAKSFINAGGKADIDCLVFKHNEHELKDFEKEMLNLGFKSVNFKYTSRFYDMNQFPVYSKNGNYEYSLEPAVKKEIIHFLPLEKISRDISIWESVVEKSKINPQCVKKNELYIDCRGNILPCCWIGSDWLEQPIEEKLPIQKLRNMVVENTKEKFSKLHIPNLHNTRIDQIQWNNFEEIIEKDKPWTCVKNCTGKLIVQ